MSKKSKPSLCIQIDMKTKEIEEYEKELQGNKSQCAEAVKHIKEEYANKAVELRSIIKKAKRELKILNIKREQEEYELLIDKIKQSDLTPEKACEKIFGKNNIENEQGK